MLKRLLLSLALVGALGACNTPAGTASPSAEIVTPSDPGLASPGASMEASPDASMEASPDASMEASPSAS